ncbi:hypothetical protein AYI68_g6495, partial [Smittium mucronatum]
MTFTFIGEIPCRGLGA